MIVSALLALRANILRTFLTMLGILIGVASIIAIVAIGSGGKAAIVSTLESNRLARTVQIIPSELVRPGLPEPGQVLQFTNDDFAVARQFSGVESVYYTLYGQAYVQGGKKTLNASINAGPSYLNEIGRFEVVQGRMYTQADLLAHRSVALVSQSFAAKMFGTENPIGQVIRLNGHPLQIIGTTLSSQVNLLSSFFGADYVYLPATTCRDIFPNWSITEMDVEVNENVDKAALTKRIVMALNIHAHSPDAFEDSTGFYSGIEHTIGMVTSILTMVIGAIAGIALVVGGVGVMNIMLVSVAERTQEIGIRMSLGARRRDILLQFLVESMMITVLGGTIGIGLGMVISFGIGKFTKLPAHVPWQVVVLSFLFSALIGIVCGLYPANKASKLQPIEALRYE
jgi:putative ABC transport system permease protein